MAMTMPRYRRRYRRDQSLDGETPAAARRREFSESFGGIDKEAQRIFLSLAKQKRLIVFQRYEELHGPSALSYAKRTYPFWKSGRVKMSGEVAERLLNLVPIVLDTATRYTWIKKLRSAQLRRHKYVSCSPTDWRQKVVPVVNELVERSKSFQLPPDVIEKVNWVMEGDSVAAQKLLAAAEEEEANIKASYIESEFRRIEAVVNTLHSTDSITHTIELPQGTVTVSIVLPTRGISGWLRKLVS